MNREPLLTVSGVTAAATAIVALVTAFGLDLTADQQTAILGVVAVLAPLIVGLVTRGRVDPSDYVAARKRGTLTYAGPAAQGTTKEGDRVDVLRAPEEP